MNVFFLKNLPVHLLIINSNYLVFSDGTGLEIRLDVSGVKVGDAHQKPGSRIRPKLFKAKPRLWKDHHIIARSDVWKDRTGLEVKHFLLKFLKLFTRETRIKMTGRLWLHCFNLLIDQFFKYIDWLPCLRILIAWSHCLDIHA